MKSLNIHLIRVKKPQQSSDQKIDRVDHLSITDDGHMGDRELKDRWNIMTVGSCSSGRIHGEGSTFRRLKSQRKEVL
jgi:hypothetical protein